jgi:multidrug efflux pump subunit AcrB
VMKLKNAFVLAAAMLLVGLTAYAGRSSPTVVVVSYLVSEQDVDRVDRLVTDPVERVLTSIPGASRIESTTGHGSVNIEVGFEGDATEQDLAAVRQRVEELVLDREVVVTSRTVQLKSPGS